MKTKCKICNHKEREIIEYLISSGAPREEIKTKFNINRVNIFNHRFHTPPEPANHLKHSNTESVDSVVDSMADKLRVLAPWVPVEQILNDLIRDFGDKLRTRYEREKRGISVDDFLPYKRR